MLTGLARIGWLTVMVALTACTAGNPQPPVGTVQEPALEVQADSQGVAIRRDNRNQDLPAGQTALLPAGQSVVVGKGGRATLRVGDLLAAELLQAGEVAVAHISANKQPTGVALELSGGVLLADFNPNNLSERRFTLQTGYGALTTTAAQLMVVLEVDTGLEWVVNLGEGDEQIQVTAGGVTQKLRPNTARWLASGSAPGAEIKVDPRRLRGWYNSLRSGESKLALSEVLLSPANATGATDVLPALPRPGRAFNLGAGEQGAVKLMLDPLGLFGKPAYALEDCNGDGRREIAVQAGIVQFDFRPLQARVLWLDVTVINRSRSGLGALRAVTPGGNEAGRDVLVVGSGNTQTLSLRSNRPYHIAELALLDGCLLGFRLSPPAPGGEPPEPQAIATPSPGDTVVNILSQPDQTLTGRVQLEALPVGEEGAPDAIQIDGRPDDWEKLARQSGLNWTRFNTITYNQGCSTRFPGSTGQVDLSGQVGFAYNSRFLYVAFSVDDDGYAAYTGDELTYFLGDSPQLALDTDLRGDLNDANRSQDDWQVDFLPDPDRPRAALWQLGSLASRPFDEAVVAATPTASGYFLEAALPWQSFETTPQPGDRLGLAANVNDSDTGGANTQECVISVAAGHRWNNPTTWGTLLLKPAE